MKIVYSTNDMFEEPRSIFLAGPTVRSRNDLSWRPAALYYLMYQQFKGQVFVPEPPPGEKWNWEYEQQVEWEEKCLEAAKCILFWIPRTLDKMPGFTTNIEFGRWYRSGKIVVGWPEDAVKMRYIDYYRKKLDIPKADTLYDTVILALNRVP